ncbi:MAG TPA: S8 family serine peptidase [Solirubrobacter sp.]|nr:S8 family serine peptidase [Solirubrobacter sp.]
MRDRQGVVEGRHRLSAILALLVAAAVPGTAAASAPRVLPAGSGGAPADWIVSARDGPAARSLAQRAGARSVGVSGRYLVPRRRAGALAEALDRRGLLRWAEPNQSLRRPTVVMTTTAFAWRDRLGLAGLNPPPVRPGSPQLALLDTPVDLTHPVFAGALLTAPDGMAPYDLHGTATASVATGTGAGGVLGVWPGMRLANHAFPPDRLTCADSAAMIDRAVARGAAVINMSYGSDERCFTEFAALQNATLNGVVVVAAAGNEREFGNPAEYPGAFPHVIAVGALAVEERAASFSNAGAAVDLAAPGVDVPAAVPWLFDPDGVADGVTALSGTSLSAPMVAAAAGLLRSARPGLTGGQVAALLCASARDLPPRGWDRRTGCGAPNVAAALRAPAPPRDPFEPNDDVVWIDGIGLGRPAPLMRTATVRATVTAHDDPVDVYRVRSRPGLRISLLPLSGGADLRVLDDTALDIADRSSVLATSRRKGRRTDRATVRKRGVIFIAVTHDRRAASRQSVYRLRFDGLRPKAK